VVVSLILKLLIIITVRATEDRPGVFSNRHLELVLLAYFRGAHSVLFFLISIVTSPRFHSFRHFFFISVIFYIYHLCCIPNLVADAPIKFPTFYHEKYLQTRQVVTPSPSVRRLSHVQVLFNGLISIRIL
jgi:hypothetical protein